MMANLAFNVLKEVQIWEKFPQEFYVPNITKMILKAEDDSFTGSQHFSKEQFLAILQSIFNPNLPLKMKSEWKATYPISSEFCFYVVSFQISTCF